MRGKEKCRALKEIRKSIAQQNDIAYAVSECTHQGECKGTCPRCEAELRYLERELEKKRRLGQTVALVGISAGVAFSTTGCVGVDIVNAGIDTVQSIFGGNELAGDAVPEPTEEIMGNMEYSEPESEEDSSCPVSEDADLTSSDTTEVELGGDVMYIPESEETSDSENESGEDSEEYYNLIDKMDFGDELQGGAEVPEDEY